MPVFPNNLSLRQLRAFDEVARQGSFAAAAKELSITQSALSESIKQLEEALGIRLFDRTTRTVGLTEAGEAFLQDVRQSFDMLEQGVKNLQDLAAVRRGKVRIAAAASVLGVMVLPILATLRARHPAIQVDLLEESAENIVNRVRDGQVDLGVGTSHVAGSELDVRPLLSDQMGIIARADSPLFSMSGQLSADELATQPFVGLTPDNAISQLLARAQGIPLNVLQPTLRVSNTPLLFEAVRLGLGFSIVPALTARLPQLRDLKFQALHQPLIERRISLIQRPRRSLSPAAQVLFDALLKRARVVARHDGIDLAGGDSEAHAT